MLDNRLGLVGMVDVILQAFLKVGEVFLYLNIMVVRNELALHEPCFLSMLGRDGDAV